MGWLEVAMWVVLVASAVWIGLAVRRTAQRLRRAVEPTRVRGLAVRGVVSRSAAARRELGAEVLKARRSYELARRDGRPVKDLRPAIAGLERVARSLDVDLRLGTADGQDVQRAREAARALAEACRLTPGRAGLLDEVHDAAERARLVAAAQRELLGLPRA